VKSRFQASSFALAGALALFIPSLFITGCQPTPKPPRGYDNVGLQAGTLSEVNPNDIVVLPVENTTGKSLPLDQVREEFHAGLVRLRYSPLSIDYVDARRPIEASYAPGQLSEEAALRVVITGWDDSSWISHSRLVIDAEVHLLDATLGQPIWGGEVSRRVDVMSDIPSSAQNRTLMAHAIEEFVGDVLASMPPRDPRR